MPSLDSLIDLPLFLILMVKKNMSRGRRIVIISKLILQLFVVLMRLWRNDMKINRLLH